MRKPPEIQEYERIVEFSFNEKNQRFVVRFLDGSSYVLHVNDLPKKMQTKKPRWVEAQLNKERTALLVNTNKEIRQIHCHIIHSRGKVL